MHPSSPITFLLLATSLLVSPSLCAPIIHPLSTSLSQYGAPAKPASRQLSFESVEGRSSLKLPSSSKTSTTAKPSSPNEPDSPSHEILGSAAGGAADAFVGNILDKIEGLFGHTSSDDGNTTVSRRDVDPRVDRRFSVKPSEPEEPAPPKSSKTSTSNEDEDNGIGGAIAGSAADALVNNLLNEVEGLFHHSSNSTKRKVLRSEEGGVLDPVSVLGGPLPVSTHPFGGGDVEDDVKGFFQGALKKVEGLVSRDSESSDARNLAIPTSDLDQHFNSFSAFERGVANDAIDRLLHLIESHIDVTALH